VLTKEYKLKITLHSLSQKDLDFSKPILDRVEAELGLKLDRIEEILLKKNLQDYHPKSLEMDGCILVHRSNGRLLLTDKNGIYDQFIKRMYHRTSKILKNGFFDLTN
jgi:hypothetical protein